MGDSDSDWELIDVPGKDAANTTTEAAVVESSSEITDYSSKPSVEIAKAELANKSDSSLEQVEPLITKEEIALHAAILEEPKPSAEIAEAELANKIESNLEQVEPLIAKEEIALHAASLEEAVRNNAPKHQTMLSEQEAKVAKIEEIKRKRCTSDQTEGGIKAGHKVSDIKPHTNLPDLDVHDSSLRDETVKFSEPRTLKSSRVSPVVHPPSPSQRCRNFRYVGIIGKKGTGRNTLAARLLAEFKVGHPRYERCPTQRLFTIVVPTDDSDPGCPFEIGWHPENFRRLEGIIFLYALDDPSSLRDITTHWFPMAKKIRPKLPPVFLVGNKLDLRQDVVYTSHARNLCISRKTGLKATLAIGAMRFFECTALTMEGVIKVEETVYHDVMPFMSLHQQLFRYFPNVTVGILGSKGTGRNTLAARLCNQTDMEQHTVEYRENLMEVNGKYEFKLKMVVVPEKPPFDWCGLDVLSMMDFIVVVYAIDEPRSFEQAMFLWLPRLQSLLKSPKFCMVGNKRDLRKVIDREQLMNASIVKTLAEEYGASDYFECSAFWNEGIQEIQEAISNVAMELKKAKDKSE